MWEVVRGGSSQESCLPTETKKNLFLQKATWMNKPSQTAYFSRTFFSLQWWITVYYYANSGILVGNLSKFMLQVLKVTKVKKVHTFQNYRIQLSLIPCSQLGFYLKKEMLFRLWTRKDSWVSQYNFRQLSSHRFNILKVFYENMFSCLLHINLDLNIVI